MPSDPLALLDDLEASVLAPDITVYIADAAGEAHALREELAARNEVERPVFLTKDDVLLQLQERLGTQLPPSDIGNPLHAELHIWVTATDDKPHLLRELQARAEVHNALAAAVDVEQ